VVVDSSSLNAVRIVKSGAGNQDPHWRSSASWWSPSKSLYDWSRCAERKLDIKILSLSRASRITSLATTMREVVSLKSLMSANDPKLTMLRVTPEPSSVLV
jgi:hypothetical protein